MAHLIRRFGSPNVTFSTCSRRGSGSFNLTPYTRREPPPRPPRVSRGPRRRCDSAAGSVTAPGATTRQRRVLVHSYRPLAARPGRRVANGLRPSPPPALAPRAPTRSDAPGPPGAPPAPQGHMEPPRPPTPTSGHLRSSEHFRVSTGTSGRVSAARQGRAHAIMMRPQRRRCTGTTRRITREGYVRARAD
jgi:hypothetical protein